MAIDSNVITLADYAKQSNVPQISMIANSLYKLQNVVMDWPLVTDSTLQARGTRLKNEGLPTVGWRKLNESTTVTKAVFDQFGEQAYILSNAIDTDVKLLADKNQIGGPGAVLGQSVMAYLEAVTYDLNDKFVNNTHTTGDADAPLGLRWRLDNPTLSGANSSCKIDFGGVDLSNGNITQANGGLFCRYLDQVFDTMGVPDGDGVVLYMNRDLRRRLSNAVKVMGAGGGFDMTTDAFDRRVMSYRNALIRTVGTKADGSTEIVTSTESSAGADSSSNYTSLYAVRYGLDGFTPWQMAPLSFQDIGIRSDEPTHYRMFIDWALGFMQQHNRAIARGYDIKVS